MTTLSLVMTDNTSPDGQSLPPMTTTRGVGHRVVRKCALKSALKSSSKASTSSASELKKWSFSETSALMAIWSTTDSTAFTTKRLLHRHIQSCLQTKGYLRNTDQIRCKLQRMRANTSFTQSTTSSSPPQTSTSASKSTTCDQPISDGKDMADNDSESYDSFTTTDEDSEYDIGYEIQLTDSESDDSLDQCFKAPIRVANDPTLSHTTEAIENTPQQRVFDGISEATHELKDNIDAIISAPKELKKSFNRLAEELTRLTDHIVTGMDANDDQLNDKYNKFMANPSHWSPSEPKIGKLVLPDINKQFCDN